MQKYPVFLLPRFPCTDASDHIHNLDDQTARKYRESSQEKSIPEDDVLYSVPSVFDVQYPPARIDAGEVGMDGLSR